MLIKTTVCAAILLGAGVAAANPRALPMTYTTDTLPAGEVEFEQFTDLVPLRGLNNASGKPELILGSEFQQEIEVGLADRLELGLYFVYVPSSADTYSRVARMPDDNGLKQRLRYTLADPGAWPVDVGVYGEITENTREVELEGKLMLQRRFDRLRIAANLVAEYEAYFDGSREIVLNPTAGATYEVTPSFHVGLDSFMRAEYAQSGPAKKEDGAVRTFGLGPQYYAGPAVMRNFGKLWWSVGAYLRVSDPSHEVQPGELYGKVWFRSMIGYNL